MNKSTQTIIFTLAILIAPLLSSADQNFYDIRDFGAKPGGESLCTKAIQKAIDKCDEKRGGTVYLPPGKWLTGTVYLQSNVNLFHQRNSSSISQEPKPKTSSL